LGSVKSKLEISKKSEFSELGEILACKKYKIKKKYEKDGRGFKRGKTWKKF